MRALILGGTGFIGSHLVDMLLSTGHSVRVLDRQPERSRPPQEGVDYRWSTFDDHFAVAEALDGVDIVYHLISSTVPSTSNLNPASDIETNLIATVRLLERMAETGPRRILFMSSGGTVYSGSASSPVDEEQPLWPICSHGVVKAAIEQYLFMYRHLHGLEPIVLRASNCYGPRQGHLGVQGLIPTLLARVLEGKPMVIWGDGSVVRDYLYVEDLAKLCVVAGQSGVQGAFNAGTGRGYRVLDIIEMVREVTGRDVEVQFEKARPYDVKEVVLDTTKVTAQFQWRADMPVLEGIRNTWDWMQTTGPLKPQARPEVEPDSKSKQLSVHTHRRRISM